MKLFVLFLTFISFCSNIHAQKSRSELAKDVDSLGDLWIFTLDKTGSMLWENVYDIRKERWTSKQIKDDVIRKLAKKGGILDQIAYSRDRISIMETGYGKEEKDSYGKEFKAAPPLDSSFVHVIQHPAKFYSKKKSGLKQVLSDRLKDNNYNYRESYVSQIRVLGLHRMVNWIRMCDEGKKFRKIHIVTITDDADVNDQWKTDYHTLKKDSVKMKQLNALHSKYVYSSFTQKGGGYLDECEQFTDVSSKNHIYMYDYVTLQQTTIPISCNEDSIVNLDPLDGNTLFFRLNQKQINSDSICFVYIDTITVNDVNIPVCQYMYENLGISQAYDINPFFNEIVIQGKVQVLYNDSIYGIHYKSYPFVQVNKDYTATLHTWMCSTMLIIAVAVLLFVFYYLYKRLLTIYTTDGQHVSVRHGFRWQWSKLTPLMYSNDYNIIFAKHSCIKRKAWKACGYNNYDRVVVIIDSPKPLNFASNTISYDTTKNNINRNADNSYRTYPRMLLEIYGKTWAGRIAGMQNSDFRWIRLKLYPILNQCIFWLSAHYYYWDNCLDEKISIPQLCNYWFRFEYKNDAMERQNRDDLWLNTYYRGNYPIADVLVCLDHSSIDVVWEVYQLNISNDGSMSNVKHLIHYRQDNFVVGELNAIKEKLKKAIRTEMGISRIVFMDSISNDAKGVHFNVSEASCMAYVCLVENTEEQSCQILYSPLRNADKTEADILIDSCAVSRHIWTSLVPFTSKKNRPSGNVAYRESSDIIREGPPCRKVLSLKEKTIKFDNIVVKSEKTK